ncbi:unnamed protein product [Echinostoma caproni]|uniref:Ufd2P_core domain-containing protein n=1 Tax=Echinostoma caproni TaxID=27848 RepID=A0A183B7H2_9TREM|nr:unnamed protein product [Echinostoma caproni]
MSFLLEEALDGLKKVRELQDLRDDSARWSELPRQQQIARMGELEQHERQVRSYLTLANQTVSMLYHLTSEIRGPFLRPEIVDKLAAMLNFNLVQLCGPRCSSLKVRNPESYGWAPKTLLAQLVAIYRHLDSEDGQFALALSKDERCFSRSLFDCACVLMSRHRIQTPEELERFARLGAKLDVVKLHSLKHEPKNTLRDEREAWWTLRAVEVESSAECGNTRQLIRPTGPKRR